MSMRTNPPMSQVTMPLVLSIFPGIDLLGRGFEDEGFCVVRGPDLIFGGDVRKFHPPPGATYRGSCGGIFNGVIGGPPCQDFSQLRRCDATGYGDEMIAEFERIVREAHPLWFLMENVPGVPDLRIGEPYTIQRIDIDGRECGCRQRRLRHFQFGSSIGRPLLVDRHRVSVTDQAAAIASEGRRQGRRSWAEFCDLQGLPPLELPGISLSAKYSAVGNGVPLQMSRLLARSISHWRKGAGETPHLCQCGCARRVAGRKTFALPCCRKRMQRRRDTAGGARACAVTAHKK